MAIRPKLLLILAPLALSSPAPAQGPATAGDASAPSPSGWEFSVAPYLWGAGLNGTLSAEGLESDIDVSFSDIWDALDVGVLGTFEARRGRLSLASNLVYMKLSTDVGNPVSPLLPSAPPGSFEADTVTQSLLVEGLAGWEVLSVPLAGTADPRRFALDLRGGFRTWWLDSDVDVKLKPGVPVGPFSRSFDESDDWIDFLLGLRASAHVTEKLALVVSGDYGGFDIGSSSHRTWSVAGTVNYQIAKHWDVGVGWRTLEIERDIVDVTMEGPLVGGRYHF